MANVYVRSGAAGAGTGADWANAYTTLSAALTAKAAGDDFWVAADHAETQASAMTLTCPGTVADPCRIMCVNHAGTVPPVSADLRTTATISTTGASSITTTGFYYCYGIQFQAASTGGAVAGSMLLGNTAGNYQRYDACVFRSLGTAPSSISLGQANTGILLNNTSFRFASTASSINARGRTVWQNTPTAVDPAGSLPATLFAGGVNSLVSCEAVDFSALSAQKLVANSTTAVNTFFFKDCKLPASINLSAALTGGLGMVDVMVVRSDSGATNYRQERYTPGGTLSTEITIVRTGGASDGTTPIAWKVITTANTKWWEPFTCFPISIWNETVGTPITVTVEGAWGGGAAPLKEEIWIDVEYPGSTLTPQGSFATSGVADALATAAGVASSETWGGSTTKFKMAATFTPQMKGPITIYVRCAKASSTFYIDPKASLS